MITSNKLKKILYLSLLMFLGILVLLKIVFIFIADINLYLGREDLAKGEYILALNYFNNAIHYNSQEPFYYKNRAHCYAEITLRTTNFQEKTLYKSLSIQDLEHGYNLNPKNIKYLRDSLYVYSLLSKDESANSIFIVKTKYFFEKLKNTYTGDVGTLVDIAVFEKNLGWKNDYEKTVSLIYKLRPDLLEWYPELPQ